MIETVGFAVYGVAFLNERHVAPREDALAWNAGAGVFVAADGVTRDWEAIRDGLPYPDPSPATDAADAAAEALTAELASGRGMEDAFGVANRAVADVNARWGIAGRCDYLERDYAGTVAAAVRFRDSELSIGWIGDCGVAVLRDGKLIYLTRDQVEPVAGYLAAHPAPFDDARRVFIRRDLRNRPAATRERNHVTYGVLTGEKEAEAYVETAVMRLEPEDVVCVHTDGFRPHLMRAEFRAVLCGSEKEWEASIAAADRHLRSESGDYGRERSMLLVRAVPATT